MMRGRPDGQNDSGKPGEPGEEDDGAVKDLAREQVGDGRGNAIEGSGNVRPELEGAEGEYRSDYDDSKDSEEAIAWVTGYWGCGGDGGVR